MTQNSLIQLRQIVLTRGTKQVLDALDLNVYPQEIVALLGYSGAGKSSLLRVLCGIQPPGRGEIHCAADLATTEIGYLMQESPLLPWRSAIQNVLLPSELGKKKSGIRDIARAMRLLEEVGLADEANTSINELSIGMRQRVAIAQTLFLPKRLVLLDEPFNALDVPTREDMYALLRQLRDNHNVAFFLVTHDFNDALVLADRICVLSLGRISWSSKTCHYPAEELRTLLRNAIKKPSNE